MQAELTIRGRARKVIMQANKNGFFYVLDRITGEFLSGAPFVSGITWALGLDSKSGRPIESPTASDGYNPVIVSPSPDGAHNWSPMAFNPVTKLVYLAAKVGTSSLHAPNQKWKYNADRDNTGYDASYEGPLSAKADSLPAPTGELLAWDPVREKQAWSVRYPVVEGGGVLATGGNLVFQGTADGIFAAYRATDGELLWRFDTGTGIMAAPVTFALDGVQYVSVMAGLGGASGLFNFPGWGPIKPGFGRILTFKLGGATALRAPSFGHKDPPAPALAASDSPQFIHAGSLLYSEYCMSCHGVSAVAGSLPDLRYASKETLENFENIVLRGTRASLGMPSFKTLLDARQVQAIRAYIISRARESATPSNTGHE
jgi:quinohemoprotein ethanol dehydrogenase